jgi:uncharacterized protein YndB with AHSA1/START domain
MKSEVNIGDNRLQMTRIFDAPRERVFAAWKESQLTSQWWGCKDTTHVDSVIDFRPGGTFTHKMQITTAGEMTYTGRFNEIIEPEKISWSAQFGPLTSRVTVEFIALGNQTKLILTQEGFPSKDLCPIVSEGFTAAFNKLEKLLEGVAA